MTLSQWSIKSGYSLTHPTTERGAVSVCVDFADCWIDTLWCLDDFKVSSVSGAVVWLVPIK